MAAIERCFCSSKEEKVNRTNSRTAMTSAAAAFVLFLNALAVIPSSRDLVEVHVCSNHTTIRICTPITECMHSRDAVCYVQLFGTNHLSRNSCNINCATGSSLSARRFEHPSAANTNSFWQWKLILKKKFNSRTQRCCFVYDDHRRNYWR